ncbi:MAG TPA: dihydrofolate reductase family protein [Candidatus Thermoplasmatota archaeon]|nr:dihydrofolate reductase family protein [Candidatus Thermoplasmatota archaeon]
MGKLIVDQFMTLDGVVQAPGGPDEDRSGGFAHGGWQAPYLDQGSLAVIVEEIERNEALLLGRRTYEIFAGYWPKASPEDPIAKKLNAMPKYVASRTLRRVEWANSTLLGPDLRQEVARIKARHGETHVIGSAGLVQSLLRERLVDRLNVWVYPLTLGSGKRLFAEGTVPTALELVRSQAFPKGAVLLTYEPRGEPTYGTVGE